LGIKIWGPLHVITGKKFNLFQVPMGVLLRDENKLDEMNDILHHFMAYVPTLTREGELTLPNEKTITVDDTSFSKILFGGDQLTAARVRGTQALLVLAETPSV